jgi:hypothetical protein
MESCGLLIWARRKLRKRRPHSDRQFGAAEVGAA